eukprot:CAMPEP_0204574382 /NCGR_PEP_ID=MMETSP0661-20131031/40569_1 /ASSEMBLY_ACC=CAM_ASM_000606 /TAXON_ID=109239 /ORGANISM="Alexandrium margalefi, Strain AMGDE01CS-322" /LENGTH=278 /DNA_ID=CAMNT_0051582903 /DNA_START=50 /DNA_END=886 /DNA_ORIENTATION=+
MAEPVELEEPSFERIETRFGSIGALAHRRPPAAGRAPFAVVLAPGNPGVIECPIGKYHSHHPGLAAIAGALRWAGVAFLQFDWTGILLSAPGEPTGDVSRWQITDAIDPEWLYQDRGLGEVVAWAREQLSDRVVLCCWNWSGYAARDLVTSGTLHGFASVSMPYNILMVAKNRGDERSYQRMKDHFEHFIPNAACRSLYVCGNQDAMCPIMHIRRLNKKRDSGEVTIHEVNQKGENRSSDDNFCMVGHEEEVAAVVVAWLGGLPQDPSAEHESRLIGA